MTKEGMLDWNWLGIDLKEWSSQGLDWEVYWVEHLAIAHTMENTMEKQLNFLWRSLRCIEDHGLRGLDQPT